MVDAAAGTISLGDDGGAGTDGPVATIDALADLVEAGGETVGHGAPFDVRQGEVGVDAAAALDPARSVLPNSGFIAAMKTAGWKEEFGAKAEWDTNDSSAGAGSGSLAVTNGNVVDLAGFSEAGARFCLGPPGGSYWFGADVFLVAPAGGAMGGLEVAYFASTDCSGAAIKSVAGTLVQAAGKWTRTQTGAAAPSSDLHSLAVRAVAIKPFRGSALKVLFDNVIVQPR
jgi:hypothetical protein